MAREKFEQAEMMTLTELEQVRVLADPLRVKVVEILCCHERTTKQVAEELGEKPTRLYHHVEALEKVGLIRQTRTRRNRGTLERYYRAVARAFRADASLFRAEEGGEAPTEAMRSMIATVLDGTRDELTRLAGSPHGGRQITEEGLLSYLELWVAEKDLARLRKRIGALVEDIRKTDDPDTIQDRRRYRLTLGFYPLDRFGDS